MDHVVMQNNQFFQHDKLLKRPIEVRTEKANAKMMSTAFTDQILGGQNP